MSYQVLARKWRPRIFREMVGQEHVLRALINALDHDRLHHAYLFTGTRGVGKTTIARILAKCLNCETGVSSEPCDKCSSCVEIAQGRSLDLIEVDAASRTKVEDTRELLDNVQYAPTHARYKIYLIDEVHMLSTHSFNALLKTLEEPGAKVLILLVTARTHRLPVTIRSRCQLLRFTIPDASQSLHWLKHNQQPVLSDSQLQQSLKYASGAPLAALDYLQQAEHQEVLAEAMTASVSGKNSLDYAVKLAKFSKLRTLEGMMSWATDVAKLKSTHMDVGSVENAGATSLPSASDTDITNEQYRVKLQVLAKKVNKHRLYRFYDTLNFNLLHSSIAVNEQLLWESLLLSWDNL